MVIPNLLILYRKKTKYFTNRLLKFPFFRITLMRFICFTTHRPAVVAEQMYWVLSLISSFKWGKDLMKPFTIFIAECSAIVRESIQVVVKKMNFQRHISSNFFVRFYHLPDKTPVIGSSMISEEVFDHINCASPSFSLRLAQFLLKIGIRNQLSYLRTIKYSYKKS